MKMKKSTAILAATVLSVSVLSGCGGSKPEKETTTALSPQDSASMDGKYAEPVTIKVGLDEDASLTYQGKETRTENSWTELYKDYGINLDVMYTTPTDNRGDKLSQAIMAGDYPDIFWVQTEDFKDYVDQGVVADITSLYKEGYFSEESTDYLNYDDQASVEKATIDGKIYGIPQLASSSDATPILWIRKDWLDNLGLEIPKTSEDFQKVALAFTNEDPDQNGQNDTFGFGMNGKNFDDQYGGVTYFFNMFGAMPKQLNFMETNEGVTWSGLLEDNMTAGLTMLNVLYKEGCIPSDFASADRAKVESDFTSGKTGMVFAPMWGVLGTYGNLLALNIDAEIIAVPVPSSDVNPEGKVYYPSATLGFWCVSSKCENPEVLSKIFNLSVHYMANLKERTQEEVERYSTGLTGKYTGGALALIPYLGSPDANYDNWKNESKALADNDESILSTPEQKNQYQQIKFFVDHKNKESYEKLSGEDLAKFNSGAGLYSVFGSADSGYGALDTMIKNDKWNREAYNSLPTDAMISNSANLSSLTGETLISMIMGNKAIDSYSDFTANWKERGGKQIMDDITEWSTEKK